MKGNTAQPIRNKAAPKGGASLPGSPGPLRGAHWRSSGRLFTPLPKRPAFGQLGASQPRGAQPRGGGGPGPGTKGGAPCSRPPSERDPGRRPRLISTTKPEVGGPFLPGRGRRTHVPGGRAGAAGIPARPLTPRRARRPARARLPADTCARRAPRASGDEEEFLLTLQPQVSAPRALLGPPAATASCEPLRQALTVKKTEQSCSHGAMAVRSPCPALVCTPAASLWPARSGRWRGRQRPSGAHHRACAASPRPAPLPGATPPASARRLRSRPCSPVLLSSAPSL